jgi:predicted AAA+ superfamily ATPase
MDDVSSAIGRARVVALLGPRQSGKTTIARAVARSGKYACDERLNYFDLEDPAHLDRLANPRLALEGLRGLIVIDEIQRRPDLFPMLRVLADRDQVDARFLILGSASRDLIRQGSETLAGRILFVDVLPFALAETGVASLDLLWTRGGFPPSFLAEDDEGSWQWRDHYIRTFLERDIPALGIRIPPAALRRFWMMLAHYHGQVFNASEIARSLGVADTTAARYLDVLAGTFMVRRLQPWFENTGKRQIKTPKIYFRDTGIYHRLMNIPDRAALLNHPWLGASWEGLAVEQVVWTSGASDEEVFFWGVHGQGELDLLIFRGGKRLGYEVKYTDRPRLTRSQHLALEQLRLDQLTMVVPGDATYALEDGIDVRGLNDLVADPGRRDAIR